MTRQRIQLKRIECDKRRRECYRKRNEGLKKKMHELSTLVDKDAFLVCYGPTGEVVTWCPDNRDLRKLVEKYQSLPAETKAKHNLNRSSYLLSEIEKQQKRLNKITAVDDLLAPCWLDDMTEIELRELLQSLDDTLERTRRRIAHLYGENCVDESRLESGRGETVSWFTHPATTSADEDVSFATETAPCFTYPTTTTPLADDENDNSMSYYSAMCSNECVQSSLAETVPQFTYPTLLDDNFATTTTMTTTTDLNQTEIPLNGYLHDEEPTADVNFNSNNVFFPWDYNTNTSPLVSTSNTSVQEENNMNTFLASTTTTPPPPPPPIYTTALYYYG